MKNKWIQQGDNFKLTPSSINVKDSLPNGIYSITQDPMTREFSLNRIADKFEFDFEIINAENKFINHVMKSYENTTGNLGILLNGLKGSGKSVTAKLIANRLNKPVILIDMPYRGISEFLASLEFDCTLFFDEFEKNFSDKDSSILQIMDGVYTSEYRRIFLLTTNETHINDNLISRPSRLRYIHEFGNLEQEVTREYLNDTLKDKSRIEDIIDFVDTLQISTIDILKSIVEEINIFGFDKFMENKSFFNVKTAAYTYRVKRAYIRNEDELRAYTVDKFLNDLKLFSKKPIRYDYLNEEEYREAYTKYRNDIIHEPEYHSISNVQKSFRSVKVGDQIGCYNSERVIGVNYNKQVFVTKDYDDGDYYFYFVENPNQKPSLTNDYLTNPYIDIF